MRAPDRAVLAWVARALVLVAIGAGIVMQVQASDWLPPMNSVSQYANGAGHWAFVIALMALGLATIAVASLVPRADRWDRVGAVLLAVAGSGFALAALIPAPAVEVEDLLGDVLHQAGAISGTFCLSIGGLLLAVRYRHSGSGRCVLVIAVLGAIALSLLTLANFNLDLTGLGRRESWALHQSTSLVCMVLMVLLLPSALARRPRRPG